MNTQLPSKIFHHPDGILEVHSIFESVQFEGPLSGTPAVFVRLHGCNLQCPHCDTDYTSYKYSCLPEDLLETIGEYSAKTVVITGGEPFRQNIKPAVELLLQEHYVVQIETNGTQPIPLQRHPNLYIVVSPKTIVRKSVLYKASAIKFIVSKKMDGYALGNKTPIQMDNAVVKDLAIPIYLQPEDGHEYKENLTFAISLASRYNNKISIQTHKLLNLE